MTDDEAPLPPVEPVPPAVMGWREETESTKQDALKASGGTRAVVDNDPHPAVSGQE